MARFSEEDSETIWDMREAGVPVKRIAKHLGRQNVSAEVHRRPRRHPGPLPVNGPSCASRWRNGRRSPGAWRPVSRSGPSPRTGAVSVDGLP